MLNRHRHHLVAALTVTALTLAACGSDSDDSSSTEPATTDAPAATDPPATDPPATDPPATDPPATDPPATDPPATDPPVAEGPTFDVAGIEDGGTFPLEMVCDQGNVPPVVTIEAVPDGTMELAFVVDDPDAPSDEPFAHWVVYGIAVDTTTFTDGDPAVTFGINDADVDVWVGPCPPEGDGPHTYVMRMIALDQPAGLELGLNARELADAVEPFVISTSEITSTHER